MWADYFRLAFRTFMTQKKRTILTLIGIFIGIAAVVSLISLGQGLQDSIQGQFELMGSDKVFIQPGTGGGFNIAQTTKLTRKDLDGIRSVSGVDAASAMVYKISKVEYKGEIKYTWVMGMETTDQSFDQVIESFGVEIEKGRGAEGTREAVLGYRYGIGDLFDKPVAVGDKFEIEGKKFKAVGSVSKIGNPQDDSQTYLPLEAALDVFDVDMDELDFIYVTVKDGEDPGTVAEKIKKALRKTRDVDEGDEDFMVQTAQDFQETFGIILTIVQIILIGIAGVSLLVGGVNIANTMYTAVMERTREIGVMKAIGARNNDVFMIFLIESGLLGLVGGIIGIVLGVGFGKLVSLIAEKGGWSIVQTVFPWYLIAGALAFSFVVGALAGT
ncbi:TPA: ABC transporter permease, partial [Candidatus Woesearchaeota archaeon]|nr:ABC transporter permease [Candidatus Woesearchaeota archaeon]